MPRSIAFEYLAVAGRLSHVQIGTRRFVRPTAFIINARAGSAEIVHAVALIGRVAPDAYARRIAHKAIATSSIQCLGRIRRCSIGAHILRARFAIVR